ncbi:MAG: hypothetical protein LBD68_11020 [Zoogloeaceae bacterium]|nr:hypothetical protein [Zoogloeaceae bacterium]
MASELSLSITVGASFGAALSAFGNLRGVMQRVADATKDLKARQGELGKTIKNAANLPRADLDRLNAQYAQQQKHLINLRAKTRDLGRSQADIAANEAKRGQLRGKIMETAGLLYAAAAPIRIGVEFEASMSKAQALTRLDKNSEEMRALTAQMTRVADVLRRRMNADQAQRPAGRDDMGFKRRKSGPIISSVRASRSG